MSGAEFLHRLSLEVERRVKDLAGMAPALAELHEGFTTGRGHRAPDYLPTASHCRAYLALSAVANAARAEHVFHRHHIGLARGQRGLDVGAGVGATALALASRSDPCSEIHLVDQSAPALELAESLFAALFPEGPKVVARVAELGGEGKALPEGTFAVATAGHVLNELLPRRGRNPGPARDVALALARRSGTLVILEPAQRVPSLALSRVRGALLEARFGVLGPCPHSGRCPVLAPGAKDWCVVDVPFRRPPQVAAVDEMLGIDRRRLTVSYLAAAKSARDPRGGVQEVLSEPMRSKQGTVIYLCGARGRVALTLPVPPKPRLPRGAWIRLGPAAKAAGRDKSGAPRIRAPGDAIERTRG